MAVKRGPKYGRVKGASKVRKLLKRLPDDVRGEVVKVYEAEAPAITAYGRAAAPFKTGRLSRAISFKIFPKTMRMRVGLIGKKLNADLFYASILENGRGFKNPLSRPIRRRLKGGGVAPAYRMRIPKIGSGEYDFIFGRAARFAFAKVKPGLAMVYERALRRAASGSSD